MRFRALRFGVRRRKRVMVNALLERKKEQDEARLEYERQADLRPPVSLVVTFADIKWLKKVGIEW